MIRFLKAYYVHVRDCLRVKRNPSLKHLYATPTSVPVVSDIATPWVYYKEWSENEVWRSVARAAKNEPVEAWREEYWPSQLSQATEIRKNSYCHTTSMKMYNNKGQ